MALGSVTKFRLGVRHLEKLRGIREETGMTTSEVLRGLIDSAHVEVATVKTVVAAPFQNNKSDVSGLVSLENVAFGTINQSPI